MRPRSVLKSLLRGCARHPFLYIEPEHGGEGYFCRTAGGWARLMLTSPGCPRISGALYWARCDFSSSHSPSCCGLPFPDHRCVAAKRQGGGSGGGIWWHGVADRLRPARLGDAVVEGDDDLGDSLHADVDFALHRGNSRFRRRLDCRFFGPRTPRYKRRPVKLRRLHLHQRPRSRRSSQQHHARHCGSGEDLRQTHSSWRRLRSQGHGGSSPPFRTKLLPAIAGRPKSGSFNTAGDVRGHRYRPGTPTAVRSCPAAFSRCAANGAGALTLSMVIRVKC